MWLWIYLIGVTISMGFGGYLTFSVVSLDERTRLGYITFCVPTLLQFALFAFTWPFVVLVGLYILGGTVMDKMKRS